MYYSRLAKRNLVAYNTPHMRIAFVGKGGSGKTTLASLFIRYLTQQGKTVLAIDADINQHLGQSLALDSSKDVPHMGNQMNRIKEYVRGSNPLITSNDSMVKTTPPGKGSRLMKLSESNPIFEYFAVTAHGAKLMATGPFQEEDIGIKCYHSKTGAVELLLNHLIDGDDEYVVVDMTAGADSFASGLFTKFDVTVLVVEPTLKSISVYNQYKAYAQNHDVSLGVIGNKLENKEDEQFIKEAVDSDYITGFGYSRFVRLTERGQWQDIEKLEDSNIEALETLLETLNNQTKDWNTFYRQAVEFHVKNAESWANSQSGEDLTKQVDENFDLVQTIDTYFVERR